MRELLPTFSTDRDRIVYLLAAYKVPLSITALAAAILLAAWAPQLPTIPVGLLWFSTSCGIVAVPGYVFGLKVAKWLHDPDVYRVGVADPGTEEIYDGQRVPYDVWNSKTVVGASPLSPDDGVFDHVVTRFNWYGDIGELEVRGCERSDLTPGEAWETKERVDDYYQEHQKLKRQYSRLKATLSDKVSEVHDLTIMRMLAEREGAELAIDKSVTDVVQEMEEAVDQLPDGPAPDSRNHAEKWLDDSLGDLDGDHLDLGGPPDQGQPEQGAMTMTGGDDPLAADGGRNE